jgi:hypothetical protein
MAASIVHRRLVLVALAAIVLAEALLLVWAGTPARAGGPLTTTPGAGVPVAESVLVVRGAGDHDALWMLSPLDGTPTAAGELPGKAGSVAVSSDAANVAYLPANGAPRVWVGYGPLGPRTVSLAALSVKRTDSFCWIDDHRLLVAGATARNASLRLDRLYLVNAATGAARSFRGLTGAEPSAAPGVGKVAYVRFALVAPGTQANGDAPTIRESLKLLNLSRPGAGRTVFSEQYQLFADHRAFSQPQVSPDATWFLTGETGSDVRVTYSVRDRWGYPMLSVFTPALQAGAGWDASGRRTAFAGVVGNFDTAACVWVYDVGSGSLLRSSSGVVPATLIDSLAWSPSGQLVANAYGVNGATVRHNLVLTGGLTTCTDIGAGRLPVWVAQ